MITLKSCQTPRNRFKASYLEPKLSKMNQPVIQLPPSPKCNNLGKTTNKLEKLNSSRRRICFSSPTSSSSKKINHNGKLMKMFENNSNRRYLLGSQFMTPKYQANIKYLRNEIGIQRPQKVGPSSLSMLRYEKRIVCDIPNRRSFKVGEHHHRKFVDMNGSEIEEERNFKLKKLNRHSLVHNRGRRNHFQRLARNDYVPQKSLPPPEEPFNETKGENQVPRHIVSYISSKKKIKEKMEKRRNLFSRSQFYEIVNKISFGFDPISLTSLEKLNRFRLDLQPSIEKMKMKKKWIRCENYQDMKPSIHSQNAKRYFGRQKKKNMLEII